MVSIYRDFAIDAGPDEVWAAVRDFGAVHERLVPGIILDSKFDGDSRVVTFASGAVARELLVGVDDDTRRLAYAVIEGPLQARHHNASIEVQADDGGENSRVVWITDVLPDELGGRVGALMDQGAAVMQRTLGGATT